MKSIGFMINTIATATYYQYTCVTFYSPMTKAKKIDLEQN